VTASRERTENEWCAHAPAQIARGVSLEETPPPEDRVAAAQRDELGGEAQQPTINRRPVKPADLVVLAVGVVVASLGAAELVATQE
jgi:hypothetical protein